MYPYFKENILRHSSIDKKTALDKSNITVWMVALLFIITFSWTSLTSTGGNLMSVLKQTAYAAVNGFTEGNRSIDANNLLMFHKVSQQDELEAYIKENVSPIRAAAPSAALYPESSYDQYPMIALPDEPTPITLLGKALAIIHINVAKILPIINQILAKTLEVVGPIGLVYLLFRRSIVRSVHREYYVIAACSLFFVGLNVLLPVLSTQYGLNRAIQQSMFVLGLPMIIGSITIGTWIKGGIIAMRRLFGKEASGVSGAPHMPFLFSFALTVVFFLWSTAFIPQLFGTYLASLHLNNTGRYYDDYVIKDTDIAGADWITNTVHADEKDTNGLNISVQIDRFSGYKFTSLSSLTPARDIFPGILRKKAYVFLGSAVVHKNRSTVVYSGDQVTYQYPIQFLKDNKNLIYNNGDINIYR